MAVSSNAISARTFSKTTSHASGPSKVHIPAGYVRIYTHADSSPTVLVGKKNLEVRPLAINKGEIVKRILYCHPDAEFVFCAGDDKTDEDMFRALLLFPNNETHARLDPPLSVTLLATGKEAEKFKTVDLAIERDAVFTTAVGHSSKRTLAAWHVTTPEEVVEHMLYLVRVAGSAESSSNL